MPDMTQIWPLITQYAGKVVLAIILLIVGFWIIGKLTKLFGAILNKREVDSTIQPFLKSLFSVALKVMLIIAVAQTLGVAATSFVAVLGALAFAIGMALQGSLGNFAGGVMLLIFKPIKVGDLISAQGFTGVVEQIQIFNTILVTPDNKTIIIPNGALSTGPIENISTKGVIRVDTTFGVGYGDDIDEVRSTIKDVIKRCPTALTDREHDILVNELGDSSVNFAVRVWTPSANYWDTYFFLHEEIKKAFDQKGVNIPYPTMDVNMVQAN